ncbi:hypothetical protein DKG77_11385 [Flagellimonas aquimarina]|jgi:hypothetical protein|uniref:Uncharacterized protein n=1 Tax=Flagellimonas aquimarina TaxID=2201895 RepID=A0A316KX97_9FLAO|nr:hypothetical protein [Allomuricauda koreensis]PWL38837.1 hypothetical protein DKG77_11385 [Allomuricauda koreensis]
MTIRAKVIPGYGAASGKKEDPRYPGGTILMQTPYFKRLGLDLSTYHPGTLNVDISPFSYSIRKPKFFFNQIKWTNHIPPENFYFFDIIVEYKKVKYEGLIYMPDPKTKTEHKQSKTTLELILPKIDGIMYDDVLGIKIDQQQIAMLP